MRYHVSVLFLSSNRHKSLISHHLLPSRNIKINNPENHLVNPLF